VLDLNIPEMDSIEVMRRLGLLTVWVIKKALQQEIIWNELDIMLPVSINNSADNITALEFPEQVSELLGAVNLTHGVITLEVIESALMGELVTFKKHNLFETLH